MLSLSRRWPVEQLAPATIVLVPLVAGAAGTLLCAFGLVPGLSGDGGAFAGWRALAAWPGLAGSVRLTLQIGIISTLLAVATAIGLAVAARRRWMLGVAQPPAAMLLAVPHAAMAAGLGFLIAPSGWLARLISPWLTGWRVPPNLAVVHDPHGFAMVLALWVKETPFLFVTVLAALGQAQAAQSLRLAATLGHGPWRAWMLTILPRVWPQVRLPVLAVLVFSLSVVDVAVILGPGEPPPLAVQLLRWFDAPDFAAWPEACAGALLLCGIAATSCGAVLLMERAAGGVMRAMIGAGRGGKGLPASAFDAGWLAAGALLVAFGAGAAAATLLWAGAGSWRFPHPWPEAWSAAQVLARWSALRAATATTTGLAAATSVLALAASVALLRGGGRPGPWIFAPLLAPQPALLWGQQVLLVWARLDGSALALVWSHLQFVLPYVMLVLADPFRALDLRYARAAAGLGVGPLRVLWRVTLPLLARPLATAASVGFAVSVALYLPTLFAGDGVVTTLATETVALASGADRRTAAAAALMQAALPCIAYAFALGVPARGRGGLAVAR